MCRGLGPKRRAAQGQEQKRAYRRSGDCDSYGTIESRMDADEHGFAHGTVGWGHIFFPLTPALSPRRGDRKSTRLNSSHDQISYAVFCLKKKNEPSKGAR